MKPTRPTLGVPSRAQILAFIKQSAEAVGKREIGKAFGLRGADKIALKALLKEMEQDGELARGEGRSFHQAGGLPKVTVLKIVHVSEDGDLLAEPDRWEQEGPKPRVRVLERKASRTERRSALGLGDRLVARIEERDDKLAVAHPLKKLERRVEAVLGVLRRPAGAGPRTSYRLEPTDKRQRMEFNVSVEDAEGAEPGELVLAEPVGRGRALGVQAAKVLQRLGSPFAPKSISLIAIHQHGIPQRFSDEAVQTARAAANIPLGPRDDLRHLPLLTIDPHDARDHDDAVWAEANGDGWRVVVAIADVSFYVRPNSALDREARERGNSVYFPDRVVPMLPEVLSADMCSLVANADRAALVCHLDLDSHGNFTAFRFSRAVIRIRANIAYEQAQAAFEGTPDVQTQPFVEASLQPLWGAWQALKSARNKRGPLEIDSREKRIQLDEQGKVIGIQQRVQLPAHQLIEDFMIAANVAAAKALEAAKHPCVYRVHESPSREKLTALKDFLDGLGLKFALGQVIKPGTFNDIMAKARSQPFADSVAEMVLRTQMQAYYTPENLGHYGLALRSYAHFTSPIRRYADLLVHRSLVKALKLSPDTAETALTDQDAKRLLETSEHISGTERRAMIAERDTTDRYIASYLSERVGQVLPGRVTGATRFGLFVTIEGVGGDGLLPMGALGDERFALDQAAHQLVGQSSGVTFGLGQKLEVRLVDANPVSGGLRFELADVAPAPKHAGPKRRFRRSRI
jgi:ribonuclease R